MKLRVGEVATVTPRAFFTELCPVVLNHQRAACEAIGATVGFLVLDSEGGSDGGSWLLDLPRCAVIEGEAAAGDLYLQITAPDLAAMLQGTLDIAAAVAEERIIVDGDTDLLLDLGALFCGKM